MTPAAREPAVPEAELRLLRALCRAGARRRSFTAAMQRLAGHSFRATTHQLVFEAIRGLPVYPESAAGGRRAGSNDFRARLQARLTLMGFPDVDLGPYFAQAGHFAKRPKRVKPRRRVRHPTK